MERIEQLGLSVEGASMRVSNDRSYFRKLFSRPHSSPRGDTLRRIAAALETTESWLLGNDTAPVAPKPDSFFDSDAYPQSSTYVGNLVNIPRLPARQEMPLDVPVFGTAAGSLTRGAFQFEGGIVDRVRRPPALMGAPEVFALYVEGSSMEPQYFPGDLIYVHPRRPPRAGDIVVVQCQNGEHSPIEASLGIYRKTTEKAVVIGKRNPSAEIELAREHVKCIQRVLTTNELFGV